MDGVFLAGLLSFSTASANPAPPATASGVGFVELARGIALADGLARRSTSAGKLLSPLGMPPEGVNPPAHTPAADSAAGGDRPARPGAGKTTTPTKPEAASGLAGRRPAPVLSIDAARIAAAEQPRALAGILGIGFQALATTGALPPAMEERRREERVPIGRPGFSPKDLDMGLDPALFSAAHGDRDTHPVLVATKSAAAPTSVIDRFEMFRPPRLRFTRLDRAETFASIPNQAKRTAKPVSFLAARQQIPEDREPAGRERTVDLAPGWHATAAPAAARRPWLRGRKKQTTNAFVSHQHGTRRRGAGTVDHGAPATGASDRQTNSRTAAGKR